MKNTIPLETDLIKQLLETDRSFSITLRSSGRIIETQSNPLPDGGVVISWNDMTEKDQCCARSYRRQ